MDASTRNRLRTLAYNNGHTDQFFEDALKSLPEHRAVQMLSTKSTWPVGNGNYSPRPNKKEAT